MASPAPSTDLLSKYSQSLTERPLLTKAATSGTLYALQELIASVVTGSNPDSAKAVKMTLYGFFVSGPLGHFLYNAMEKIFEKQEGPKVGILKLLFSNLVITPITNASYLFALASFAGANPAKAVQIVQARLLGLMKFFVPFFNLVAFCFGTLINIQAKLEAKKKPKPKAGGN
ncbi:hypothetical protein HDU91_003722 [Kappamyces sp. JEL0680]|nr:hypothetical protein HDU91_003722 [Kappamyces sp. JEL0680]